MIQLMYVQNLISLEWIAKKVIEITNKKNISYSINNSNLGENIQDVMRE